MSLPEYRCPRCYGPAQIVPRSWNGAPGQPGNVLACCSEDCDTWVAVHSKTMRPMGRMAGHVTRAKRRDAHAALDPLWLRHGYTREQVYTWVSDFLEVPHSRAHIGWLTDDQLDRITAAALLLVEEHEDARSEDA